MGDEGFDADMWGASRGWEPAEERSVYDDDLEDDEAVPLAQSLITIDAFDID
jgi:hypothetical protein